MEYNNNTFQENDVDNENIVRNVPENMNQPDFNQNAYNQVNYGQNNYNMNNATDIQYGQSYGATNHSENQAEPKKNGAKTFFLILLALIAILLIVMCVMFLRKSDEQKFFELLTVKQDFVQLSNDINKNNQDKEQVDTMLSIDLKEMLEEFGSKIDEEFVIELNSSNINKADDLSGKIEFVINEKDLLKLEYAKTGEIYGIKLDDVTDKFIAVKNEEINELFEKFGIEDAESLPERFLEAKDFEKVMKLDNAKLLKILNKYSNSILKCCKDKVKIEKDIEIKIGDEDLTTTKYSLDVTEKLMYDIVLALVEELKDDKANIKLVLDDIKAILKLMEDNGYQVEKMYGSSLDDLPNTEEICEELQKAYEKLKEAEETFDEKTMILKVVVHEFGGKNIMTEFIFEEDHIIRIKSLNDKNVFIAIELEEDEEVFAELLVEGTVNQKELDITYALKAEDKKIKILNIKQKYSNKAEGELISLSDKNAIILNDASEEDLEDLAEELEDGFEEFGENLSEKIEDIEIFKELSGNQSFVPSQNTISNASFASFMQEFSEFKDSVTLDYLDLKADYSLDGVIKPSAQLYYEVATGKKASTDVTVPEGIKFNYDFLKEDEICYEIKVSNITGFEDKNKLNLYGSEYDDEKYYVTNLGKVFTLPGFERIDENGNVKYYVDTTTYYTEDEENLFIDDDFIIDKVEDEENEEVKVEEDDFSISIDSNADGSKTLKLFTKAKKMYDSVNIGDSKEKAIDILGEPSDISVSTYDSELEFAYWMEDDIDLVFLMIEKGVVCEKSIEVESEKYEEIFVGKAINTEIEDLTEIVSKVKENMTLKEVKAILGNSGFEKERDDFGSVRYIWYDKKEQNVEVEFYQDKAWYVSPVRQMW